jgi:hypothetical protein
VGKHRPVDAARYEVRMQALKLWSVERQSLKAISEQLGVLERTLRDWLHDMPRLKLGG